MSARRLTILIARRLARRFSMWTGVCVISALAETEARGREMAKEPVPLINTLREISFLLIESF